jgi:hypothetical protein
LPEYASAADSSGLIWGLQITGGRGSEPRNGRVDHPSTAPNARKWAKIRVVTGKTRSASKQPLTGLKTLASSADTTPVSIHPP